MSEPTMIDPALVPDKPANIEFAKEEDRLAFPLPTAHFKGDGVHTDQDEKRLRGQYERIFRLMHDRKWRTLEEIAAETKDPPASISAQLRFMTRPEFGSHVKNKNQRSRGLYEYQIVCNREKCFVHCFHQHRDPMNNWLRQQEKVHGR